MIDVTITPAAPTGIRFDQLEVGEIFLYRKISAQIAGEDGSVVDFMNISTPLTAAVKTGHDRARHIDGRVYLHNVSPHVSVICPAAVHIRE